MFKYSQDVPENDRKCKKALMEMWRVGGGMGDGCPTASTPAAGGVGPHVDASAQRQKLRPSRRSIMEERQWVPSEKRAWKNLEIDIKNS